MRNYKLNVFKSMLLAGIHQEIGYRYYVQIKKTVNDITVQFERPCTGRIGITEFSLAEVEYKLET